VFYWGIKKEFAQLSIHNILFSENYEEEFNYLFTKNVPFNDPTIYINITSKHCKTDAPSGCENWFVMVNVPHNSSGKDITYEAALRKNVVSKINRMLGVNIETYIDVEHTLNPFDIETQTGSFGGSLYGNSSNNKFSAFLRHANYSSKLCLLSGKIASKIIQEKHGK
jgi:phytoene dehydrogenase-like protein